ncbi:MAG TPA: hypothetical protein VJV03_07420 [Pyrinomonadaceae bacterium]|nr:hypothetical protein [Pyrinomonadaceae bacterium]
MTNRQGFLTTAFMILLAAVFAMPVVAAAQGNGRGRGKPVEVFVNGHDARDGRTDRTNQRRGRDRDRDDDWRRRNRNRDWRNDDNWRGDRASDGYGNYGGSFDLRQTALNAGFSLGAKEGRRDRERGERLDWRDESKFQSATEDYSSRLGNRELYRTYFRQAFENGYKDGYAGY